MKKHFLRILILLLFLVLLPLATPATPAASVNAASTSIKTYKNTLCKENGKLYYYNSRGKRVKSCWKTITGKKYYFRYNGQAATGFVTIRNKRYCFAPNGVLRTGWYKKGSSNYYFHKSTGVMATGWTHINGKSYYFKNNGVMAKSCWIKGKYIDKNGIYQPKKKPSMNALQKKLKNEIKNYRGKWSIYVKNLNTNQSFTINNRKVYAASLIKLFAMSTAYDRIKADQLKESSVSNLLNSMITVSSNDAFNNIVRKIGRSRVNSWCKANGYRSTKLIHELPRGNNNFNLSNSNYTTVKDCGQLLESIYRGKCVSRSASKKMLNLLKQQTRRTKIPAGVPSGVTVANKTGETDDVTHDAAIVYSRGATYILCVMGDVPGYGWNSAGNVKNISRIVYQYFN